MRRFLPLMVLLALSPAACIEHDGPPLAEESIEQNTSCAEGATPRQSVDAEMLNAFPECCNGWGHLLPPMVIPEDFQERLEKHESGALCVPNEFATDADYTPLTCTAIGGLPGACLSDCVPEVKNADVQLTKSTCPDNQYCAPCRDPRTGEETGACDFGEMACHKPPEIGECDVFEPTLGLDDFESCCPEGRAHCAPAEFVPEHQRKDLSSCGEDGFCVPDDLLARAGRYQPPTCKSVGGVEGRCLSVCVKSVAAEKDMLPQDTCKPDERCAPCYDPRTGQGTGACTLGPCDKPTNPPETFEKCGAVGDGSDAVCVPSELVPDEHRSRFDNRGCGQCTKPGFLCVPQVIVDAGPTFAPKACTNSMTGLLALVSSLFSGDIFGMITKMKQYQDGRCVSKCIPEVRDNESAKMLGNKGCAEDELCVPCYDPMKMAEGLVPTGACDF